MSRYSDYAKRSKEWERRRFFGTCADKSNKYFTFNHYVSDNEIVIITNNIATIKDNYILIVGNNSAVYLKDFCVVPVHSYKERFNAYAVKLKREYFKPYTFRSEFEGFYFEQPDDFDALVRLAKEQDKEDLPIALGHLNTLERSKGANYEMC
jgi:hypothetical protein